VRRLSSIRSGKRILTPWITKTAMVYEFTSSAAERQYEADRLAFNERFGIPQNLWIWVA
jgi:hypothetical protein